MFASELIATKSLLKLYSLGQSVVFPSTMPHIASWIDHSVGVETSRRTQTLNHKKNNREGGRYLRGSARCLRPGGRREIYLWFTQDYM